MFIPMMIKHPCNLSQLLKIFTISLILTISCGVGPGYGNDSGADEHCSGPWYHANLTYYISYPPPDSEECLEYNGCEWAGYFYGLDEQQTEQWVALHNIVAVHSKDWEWLGMRILRIRQGSHSILAKVYDLCSDTDCNSCCTQNLGGDNYLIDMEFHTTKRFGSYEGIVEFQVCDEE